MKSVIQIPVTDFFSSLSPLSPFILSLASSFILLASSLWCSCLFSSAVISVWKKMLFGQWFTNNIQDIRLDRPIPWLEVPVINRYIMFSEVMSSLPWFDCPGQRSSVLSQEGQAPPPFPLPPQLRLDLWGRYRRVLSSSVWLWVEMLGNPA